MIVWGCECEPVIGTGRFGGRKWYVYVLHGPSCDRAKRPTLALRRGTKQVEPPVRRSAA
jgi:hypothetical protein